MSLPNIVTQRIGRLLPSIPGRSATAPVPPSEPSAVDVVGVFDEDFTQVFPDARPMRASVYEAAKVMDHPVETGGTMTDHRVIQPIEIELSMMLTGAEYKDVYNQIKGYFKNASLLIVQTRTGSYPSMLVAELPHEETPDEYDTVPLALRMREAILVTTQFQALPPKAVAKPRNASTVKRGQQNGKVEPVNAATGKTDSQSTFAGGIDFFGGAKYLPRVTGP